MWRRIREGGYTQAITSDKHLEMQKLDLVLLENWPACTIRPDLASFINKILIVH